MPLPRSLERAVEINRGCDPRSTRPLTLLSPAPLRGAGERRYTLTSRGLHPWLSTSRPSGACLLFLLRLCSGQALRKGGQAFQTASYVLRSPQLVSLPLSCSQDVVQLPLVLWRNLFIHRR